MKGLLILIILGIIFVSGCAKLRPEPIYLDMDCYQEKCKSEETIWDDSNARCICVPESNVLKVPYEGKFFDCYKSLSEDTKDKILTLLEECETEKRRSSWIIPIALILAILIIYFIWKKVKKSKFK